MLNIAQRFVLPAMLRYQRDVAEALNASKAAGVECGEGRRVLERLCGLVCELIRRTDRLEHAVDHEGGSPEDHARHCRDAVIPAMASLRETADELERMSPHDVWPLPSYREMLFIK
jgi:glutamine synthetase